MATCVSSSTAAAKAVVRCCALVSMAQPASLNGARTVHNGALARARRARVRVRTSASHRSHAVALLVAPTRPKGHRAALLAAVVRALPDMATESCLHVGSTLRTTGSTRAPHVPPCSRAAAPLRLAGALPPSSRSATTSAVRTRTMATPPPRLNASVAAPCAPGTAHTPRMAAAARCCSDVTPGWPGYEPHRSSLAEAACPPVLRRRRGTLIVDPPLWAVAVRCGPGRAKQVNRKRKERKS